MQIGSVGPNVSPATGMPPLSDAGSILAQSVEISDDGGAYMDGYELDFSAGAFE